MLLGGKKILDCVYSEAKAGAEIIAQIPTQKDARTHTHTHRQLLMCIFSVK